MNYFSDSDADEIKRWCTWFDSLANGADPGLLWCMAVFPAALIQVYDLVLPVDPSQAGTYISRLGMITGALLANRDDKRHPQNPPDPFRGRVMPAWGAVTHDRDDQWNTDVVTSGLFVYVMAAFARRVVDLSQGAPDFMKPNYLGSRRVDALSWHLIIWRSSRIFWAVRRPLQNGCKLYYQKRLQPSRN